MTATIYIARHGQTDWNRECRLQGELDSSLTNEGILQSQKLAEAMRNNTLDIIISSPLGRAVSTANICSDILDVPLCINQNIKERNLGNWQGKLLSEVKREPLYSELLQQITTKSMPNGESAVDCGSRLMTELLKMSKQHSNILLICHGEILRCLVGLVGQSENGNAFELHPNCGVLTVTSDSKQLQIL